jgi:hypothetical protein
MRALYDVYVNPANGKPQFMMRAPMNIIRIVLELRVEAVARVLAELERMPGADIHHNGHGRWAGASHTIGKASEPLGSEVE